MGRIATIGFFDGVHKGHRFLFEQLVRIGASRDLRPLIVTFENHPRSVLQRAAMPHLLTSTAERRELLSAYGEVLMLPFEQIQPLTAEQFMEYLHREQDVQVLLMGYDHRFGSDRLTDPEDYRRLGALNGIEVLTMQQYTDGASHISSTEIRRALERGEIAAANDRLGRLYSLHGEVVHGKGLGRKLGFPTANIHAEPCKLLPKAGVYEVKVRGERLEANGICNIDSNGLIETHIPDYSGDLYGRPIEVQFIRFIRDEQHFASLDALKNQIKADVDSIRRPV